MYVCMSHTVICMSVPHTPSGVTIANILYMCELGNLTSNVVRIHVYVPLIEHHLTAVIRSGLQYQQ